MQARDLMTTTVISVAPDEPTRKIAQLLLEHGISAVPGRGCGRRPDRHGQ